MGLILITNKPTNGFYKAVNDIPTNQGMDYMYIYIHTRISMGISRFYMDRKNNIQLIWISNLQRTH